MRFGKHYIDPSLGLGIVIGLMLGVTVSNLPGGFAFIILISAFIGYAIRGKA